MRGWSSFVIQNSSLRVTVLAGKGCDVVEVLYKPRDLDLTPRTARGLRSRDEVLAGPWSELGAFMDQYEGGWQEILPHGGGPGSYRGASFPQHGESARLPWRVAVIENSPERVEVTASVRLSIMPFYVIKSFVLEGATPVLKMSSTVTNEAAVELPLMWGQHLAFGSPLVGPGSRIELQDGTYFTAHPDVDFPTGRRSNGGSGSWPTAIDENGETFDLSELPPWETPSDLQYLRPSIGRYTLLPSKYPIRVHVNWDIESFPYLWFWQQFGSSKDYPWWGTEYIVGLEPWTSAPGSGLADAVEFGEVPILPPGGSKSMEMNIQIEEEML